MGKSSLGEWDRAKTSLLANHCGLQPIHTAGSDYDPKINSCSYPDFQRIAIETEKCHFLDIWFFLEEILASNCYELVLKHTFSL